MKQNRTPESYEVIEAENELLENYFANTIIPQLFVDGAMTLRKFTPPAMRQFSLSDSDIGRPIEDLKDHIRYPTFLEDIIKVITTGELYEGEIQTTDRCWFQMNILPYVERRMNRTNGVIITFVDITDRIAVLREFEKMNAERQTLLFALNHDIRQPLFTIGNVVELLKEGGTRSNEIAPWLEMLSSASATLKGLVADLDLHLQRAHRQKDTEELQDIKLIYNEVMIGLKEDATQARSEIRTTFEGDPISFPHNKLRSIMYNLLSNAIKFRRDDRPLQLAISTANVAGEVILRVQDNGKGIDPRHHKIVFDRNTRLNDSVEGTGMGLYIIRRMLEDHGSRIVVESEIGKGSTFTIRFRSAVDRQAGSEQGIKS